MNLKIANWKLYLAGKAASAAVFIPSLYYTIVDSFFHLDDLIINNKPEGINILRDLALLTLSTISYIICDNLYQRETKCSPETNAVAVDKPAAKNTIEDLFEEPKPAAKPELAKQPQTALEFYNAGKSASNKKDYASAESYFNKAVSLEPQDSLYYGALAIALFNQDKFKLALSAIEKAVRLEPDCPGHFETAGEIYGALKDDARSQKAFAYANQLRKKGSA